LNQGWADNLIFEQGKCNAEIKDTQRSCKAFLFDRDRQGKEKQGLHQSYPDIENDQEKEKIEEVRDA
jgi:hypothetical protein